MTNIKNLGLNKIKIDEESFIYYTGYVVFKDLEYVKTNGLNPLCLIINKISGYFEKIDGNKNFTLVLNNDSNEIIKKYDKLCGKIKDQIRTITNKSDYYDEKYMKNKIDLDDNLALNKTLEIHKITIVVKAVFHEDNKYYPHFFLDECLYKL